MSLPKSSAVAAIRQRSSNYAEYSAQLLEATPGDTLGEAIFHTQSEQEALLRKKQLCLAGGLSLISLLSAEFALNSGAVGSLHTLARMAVMLGGAGLIVTGGVTGDAVTSAGQRQNVLTDWARELRNQGPADAAASAELVRTLEDSPVHTRAELLALLDKVEEKLVDQPGALAQVRRDRSVIARTPGDTVEAMYRTCDEREALYQKLSTAGLVAGGLAAMSAMFIPPVGFAGIIGMAASLGGGVLAQDQRDNQQSVRNAISRWELNLADLKSAAWLARDSAPGSLEVAESYIQVGDVTVPIEP